MQTVRRYELYGTMRILRAMIGGLMFRISATNVLTFPCSTCTVVTQSQSSLQPYAFVPGSGVEIGEREIKGFSELGPLAPEGTKRGHTQ